MKYILLTIIIIIVVGIVTWIIMRRYSLLGRDKKKMANILPTGWQFYSNPTTLEPPGTVFRIDTKGRKYIVEILKVPTNKGKEAAAKCKEMVESSISILARFLGLKEMDVGTSGKKMEQLEYEIYDPVKEQTTDAGVKDALQVFKEKVEYIADNRYFIIRESRLASGMKYILNEQQFNEIGGNASVENIISAGSTINSKHEGIYELTQKFPEPMRVMFLPEEIATVAVSLPNLPPELVLKPVNEVLIWEDGHD